MPTKGENKIVYIATQEGEMHELNGIDNVDIEPDFTSALENFGLQIELLIKEYRSFVLEYAPNNWLKMHGHPMRRKFRK